MHDFQEQFQIGSLRRCVKIVVIYFKTICNKTIIRFVFFDIRNNQGLGKRYQPRPSARLRTLTTLTSASIHPDITKTSSNKNNLKFSGYITNVRMHGFFFQLEVRHENQSNRPHVRIELDIIHYFKNIISLTFKVLYCIHLQSTLRQKGDDGYSGLKDA